jgi:hypothetical protein
LRNRSYARGDLAIAASGNSPCGPHCEKLPALSRGRDLPLRLGHGVVCRRDHSLLVSGVKSF